MGVVRCASCCLLIIVCVAENSTLSMLNIVQDFLEKADAGAEGGNTPNEEVLEQALDLRTKVAIVESE